MNGHLGVNCPNCSLMHLEKDHFVVHEPNRTHSSLRDDRAPEGISCTESAAPGLVRNGEIRQILAKRAKF